MSNPDKVYVVGANMYNRTAELAQILRNALADSDPRRPYMSVPRAAVLEVAALLERKPVGHFIQIAALGTAEHYEQVAQEFIGDFDVTPLYK